MSSSLQNGAPQPHFAVGAMTSDFCGLLGHGTVRADPYFIRKNSVFCALMVALATTAHPQLVVSRRRFRWLVAQVCARSIYEP